MYLHYFCIFLLETKFKSADCTVFFIYFENIQYYKDLFTLDDNDIIFLLSSVNGIISDHATLFFFSFLTAKNIEKSASFNRI